MHQCRDALLWCIITVMHHRYNASTLWCIKNRMCQCDLLYSKTWVSDHLAWATTLPWAIVFSCTDAILVHFTLSPATTWQTRPVAYLELVIYLLNATIILLQNTKLTVKFARDGRPYPHLTPHCRWPGRLLFMVGPWLTGTRGSQTPCGLLTIAHLIALASLNVFRSTRFALFNRYRMWQMAAVNQTFLRHQMNAGKPCYTKECEVTPNWTRHKKRACYLDNKNFYADIVVWFVVVAVAWFTQKLIPIINRPVPGITWDQPGRRQKF